jgi:hypothetical protein
VRLFPTLDRAIIARVLRNKNGNIQAAIDVLRTLVDDDNPTSSGDRQQEQALPVSTMFVHYSLKSAYYCKSEKSPVYR